MCRSTRWPPFCDEVLRCPSPFQAQPRCRIPVRCITQMPTSSVLCVTHLSHMWSDFCDEVVRCPSPFQAQPPCQIPVLCVTQSAHLVGTLRNTIGMPRQCVALHNWHTSSVRCITRFAHLGNGPSVVTPTYRTTL